MEEPQRTLRIELTCDSAINYAFQQNAIPVVKELRLLNDNVARKNLTLRITTEPAFATPLEIRLQSIGENGEFRLSPVDVKLGHDFLYNLNEKVTGLLKIDVEEGEASIASRTESVRLLAHNEWCGLVALPEILAAFVLPNDPAIMPILSRAAEFLKEATGRGSLNGYQDKSRKRVWEQIAAIYKAIGGLGIRYINPPASFEDSGQKVRFPSIVVEQRFGTCVDLALLFAACCEQAGLRPLILIHQGHAYAGCWLEERTLSESASDDLQHIRKLATDEFVTVFETTLVASEAPGTLNDAELSARSHLRTELPFRYAIDVYAARKARIQPLPIPGQLTHGVNQEKADALDVVEGIGGREFVEYVEAEVTVQARVHTRIDLWKSRLLDLSLRNRLLNFRETKSTVRILSAEPEKVEDELAAGRELSLRPKPKVMGDEDPRNAAIYASQQRADAQADHLRDELALGRLHTHLDDAEHQRRLTELFRAARNALDENGTNTLFAAVGILEWRETEHSDRVHSAPILLVPVELKRKSILEGFALRRIDEETRLNVTLMEMLRQNYRKEIPGLDPLPEDESGVNVALVLQRFRDAVREMAGWEVKTEVWLGQFSFNKFLLWKDLADRLESLTQNRIVHHLVHEAGVPFQNPRDDITPGDLDTQFHPREVFCTRSADSSQLAAVMAAAAGHDFVLEGPPGTGKSQTITNIIAHCLAHGKRVLFVAEKRAALDVVHRRLREEGLEPFCLELHSNKAGKADVVAQFDRSLKLVERGTVSDWELRTADLKRLRNSLNEYSCALHRKHPCGLSAFQCLDHLLPRQFEKTIRLENWPDILETKVETLERMRQVVRVVQERSKTVSPLANHPLSPLGCEDWTPAWSEHAKQELQDLGEAATKAGDCCRELRSWMQVPKLEASRKEALDTVALVESLLAPVSVGPAFASKPWTDISQELEILADLVSERSRMREDLAGCEVRNGVKCASARCEAWSGDVAESILNQCRELGDLADQALQASNELRIWLRSPRMSASRTDLINLYGVADCLLEPAPVRGSFATSKWEDWCGDLDSWILLVRERNEIRSRLKDHDEVALLALDLDDASRRWDAAAKAWFLPKWLNTIKVLGRLRSASVVRTPVENAKVGNLLADAIRLRAINKELESVKEKAEEKLGPIWALGEPKCEVLEEVTKWGAKLHKRLVALADSDPGWLNSLRQTVAALFEGGTASYAQGTEDGYRLAQFNYAFAAFNSVYEALAQSASISREGLDDAPDHLLAVKTATFWFSELVARVRQINDQLDRLSVSAKELLGKLWMDGNPSSDAIVKAREWGGPLHSRMLAGSGDDFLLLGKIRQLLGGLFNEGPEAYAAGTTIGNRFVAFKDSFESFERKLENITATLNLRPDKLHAVHDFFNGIVQFTEGAIEKWPRVRDWCMWQRIRREAGELRLNPLIDELEKGGDNSTDFADLFERSFRKAFFFALLESEPALRDFFGREHNERITSFREIDEKLTNLAREVIRARLAAGIPRDQGTSDIPKNEIGLLRKEIAKRARHIPVRQLLGRIPKLLPKLKPCVLMSPLSVAQYLEASHEAFDVVIFDEASQIPVWDAVGAIARGKQLIVVGDPKQLPPTNFFASVSDDEENLTPEEHKDLESILDELLTNGLRHKRLKWHYRSRNESLIAFSNRQYYDNDLLTFPSPETAHGGVRLKYLPDATYDKGKSRTNRIEAETMVKELVGRLLNKNEPKRSYGIVTFSQAQQQLVENLLDEERRGNPEIEVHFGDEPPIEGEPIFVKNLENVQGDERDVIFFSICYGRDEAGKISMNFGPLNRDGGERRLNVAITRAKHEVIVFSGLRCDHIDLTRTRARGVRDLKYFLDYAERGPRALASATMATGDSEADSEFERLVAEQIRNAGYEVHHQIGCSGYRVDLGIVDPSAPGRYILGVECDGATYHRAATARDRDKLRQAILQDLGWKLHRIWSTDWWHDAEGEMAKLLESISAAERDNVGEQSTCPSEGGPGSVN